MFLSTDFTFPQLHTFPKFTLDFSSPDYSNLPGSTCHSLIHRIFIWIKRCCKNAHYCNKQTCTQRASTLS